LGWWRSPPAAGRYRERVLTLLLTRHGHTDRSEPDAYLGQTISARLTDRGRADAHALADRLAAVAIDRVITSPLERALETARIVAGDRLVEADARLAEMDYGTWEGLTVDEIATRFAAEYARYEDDPSAFHVGGAESGTDVARRLNEFLTDLLDWWEARDDGPRTCLVIGHASVNRVLLATCLGVPLRDYRRRFQFDWAGLSVLRWTGRAGGPTLLLANDVGHLRGVSGVTWE
jgi:broad specificity phosphatase PhoE